MQYMFSVVPIDVRPTMTPANDWTDGMDPAGGPPGGYPANGLKPTGAIAPVTPVPAPVAVRTSSALGGRRCRGRSGRG